MEGAEASSIRDEAPWRLQDLQAWPDARFSPDLTRQPIRMLDCATLTVVVLTPPGRGAIATVLVEGAGALSAVAARFRAASGHALESFAPDRLAFGRFGGEPGEEVVVRVRSLQSIEIHCHGGHAAVAMLCQSLIEAGCTPMAWPAWIARQADDPIAWAAMVALAEARTERTAAILLDQYQGALRRAILSILDALNRGDLDAAREEIDRLLGRAPVGLHVARPWRVVVAGPPNAGKSSLVNAILGYGRAIVDPAPGTTRDLVTATTAIEGWPVELCDTAGLRESRHPVERAGVELAEQGLAAAELVLMVFDLSQPWSSADERLVQAQPGAILVHNKTDLIEEEDGSEEGDESNFGEDGLPLAQGFGSENGDKSNFGEDGPPLAQGFGSEIGLIPLGRVPFPRPPGVRTSALRGEGVEQLLRVIAKRLVPNAPPVGAAMPFTEDQAELLRRASEGVAEGDARSAQRILESLIRKRRG